MMRTTLTVAAIAAVVAGCSGGAATTGTSGSGGSGGSGCTTNCTSSSISIALSSQTASLSAPITVKSTVVDANGHAIAGAVVNFAVNPAIGALSAASALTDGSGVASVTLKPAAGVTTTIADTVTASATVDGTALTKSTGYQVNASGAEITSFTAPDLGGNALPAYGQTELALQMSGVSAAAPASLSLTSDCVQEGTAAITPATTTTTTGSATFTYQDIGACGATHPTDNITVTSSGLSKTLQLQLTASAAAAVVPKAPDHATIYLQGAASPSTATVPFQVVDITGKPKLNEPVTLDLTTYAGGLKIDGGSVPVTKNTDNNGMVSVVVTAGTVPTPVRVKAVLGTDINGSNSAISTQLAVGTGLPTETGFALSEFTLNIEGYNYNNAWNQYTISAADRSGNPIPPSTSISLVTERGLIPSSVLSPATGLSVMSVDYSTVNASQVAWDGHVTLLAYALGEESFQDQNGNNSWDAGEPFQDLGDPYKDVLFDGVYVKDDGDEYFSYLGEAHGGDKTCPYPQTGIFAIDATIPSMQGTCDGTWSSSKVYVRRAIETVMSTSIANPYWYNSVNTQSADFYTMRPYLPATCTGSLIQLSAAANSAVEAYSLWENPEIYVGATATKGSISILLTDGNPIRENPVAQGTVITLDGAAIGGSPVINTLVPTGTTMNYDLTNRTEETHKLVLTSPGPMLQGSTPTNVLRGAQTTTTLTFTIHRDNPPNPCVN